jgi:hypothetical protein
LIVNLSTIMAYVVASVFFFGAITFVTVCTEVVTTQERSHAYAKTFQRFLIGYQIHVISGEHFNGIVYLGPTADNKIYLYLHDNHYNVITSMTAFLSRNYFCANCYKGYSTKED